VLFWVAFEGHRERAYIPLIAGSPTSSREPPCQFHDHSRNLKRVSGAYRPPGDPPFSSVDRPLAGLALFAASRRAVSC
jgi:hypothetical protein